MQVDGIAFDAATMSPIVMLTDSEGRRALPIWISQDQAKAIKLAINKQVAPRPLTHDLSPTISHPPTSTFTHCTPRPAKIR